VSDEGWTVVRVGTNEYGVTLAGPPGSLFYAVQINHEQLMAALTQSAAVAGGDAGLTIEVLGARDAVVSPGPLLAERRLASPLDRVTLVAYPADSQAFLANVRLQTRLYGWGGFVLIISGVVGGWLMWREAVREIRAARERSDFAAAVSHDLRTPLSSMRMLAESLYLGRIEDESKRKRFLQTILKESDRLSRLTDRALYFIRFGQGALRYRMTEGDLGGVVKDVVETFATGIEGEVREAGTGQKVDEASRLVGRREEASGRKVDEASRLVGKREEESQESEGPPNGDAEQRWRIDLRISSDLPAVRFDAGAMEQVVFNLLDNAVKYSRDNRLIEVSIGEETSRRHIRVAVKDYGLGIDQKDLKRIFKAYQRGGSSKNAAGLGLGLALCHDVVKAHRGTIEVDSQPGCGSTFTVVLPAV
jgi:signal transduction histidine kinase